MKKLNIFLLGLLACAMIISGCSSTHTNTSSNAPAAGQKVLKVGATAVPHAEILNFAKPLLAKEGIDLQIVEFSDYVQPNVALAQKELDANYFQHIPYLTKFSTERNLPLTYGGGTYRADGYLFQEDQKIG